MEFLARTHERGRCLLLALLVTASLGPCAPARATTPNLFGMGPRAISLGGAYVAVAEDAYATYYNPAGLAYLSGTSLSVDSFFVWPDLDPLQGVVVGEDAGGNALYGGIDPRVEDQIKLDLGIGMPIPFHLMGKDRQLGVGVLMQMPAERAFTLSSRSALEPGYVRYRHNMDMMFIYIGVGTEIIDGISIGAGVSLLFALNGRIDLDLSIAGEPGTGEMSLSAPWNLFPTAGIQARVLKGLKLGLAYRAEYRMDVENFKINVNAYVGSGGALFLDLFNDLFMTAFFMPQQVAAGCAYEPSERWTLAAEVTWADWSRYRNTSLQLEIEGSMNISGLPPIPLPMPFTQCPPSDFHDTWIPRVGVEWRPGTLTFLDEKIRVLPALRGGFFWEPSPAPPQTGITNLVDNDRYVYSLGAGFNFGLRGSNKALSLDLAFQHSILEGRDTLKCCEFMDLGGYTTRVLGYPGYHAGGNVFVLSAGMTLKF